MRATEMNVWCLIEICSDQERDVLVNLIHNGYRASRMGLVAFVLHGIDPDEVAKMLVPLIPYMPMSRSGILYMKMDDAIRVQQAVLSAEMVFVATGGFLDTVLKYGVNQRAVWPTGCVAALLPNPVQLGLTSVGLFNSVDGEMTL